MLPGTGQHRVRCVVYPYCIDHSERTLSAFGRREIPRRSAYNICRVGTASANDDVGIGFQFLLNFKKFTPLSKMMFDLSNHG